MECQPHQMWIYRQKDNRTGELCDEFLNGVEELDTLLVLSMSSWLTKFSVVHMLK